MLKLVVALFAAAKFGKILTTVGTMVVSIGAYALIWGWPFAVGFVLLILVHELGHFIAARQRGLDVGAPTFIPFVGAWIQLKEQPFDVETEAYIALAGPVTGTIAAVACYFAAREWGSQLLLALAFSGLMLNLFNLIPLSPLDGGRIAAILSPQAWIIGLPILLAVFLWRPSPLLVLIGIAALPQIFAAFRNRGAPPDPAQQRYYAVALNTRLTYGAYYLGLASFLAIMAGELHSAIGR
jgi:Zn-dependent protease